MNSKDYMQTQESKKDETKCKFLNNLVQNAYEKDAISFYNEKCLQGE